MLYFIEGWKIDATTQSKIENLEEGFGQTLQVEMLARNAKV